LVLAAATVPAPSESKAPRPETVVAWLPGAFDESNATGALGIDDAEV
jgi:hypothetical protein